MNISSPRIIFILHKYNSFFRRILIAICIDLLLLSILLIWMNADSGFSIVKNFIALVLFVINLGFAVVSRFVKRSLYLTFLFNSILAPFIFALLFYISEHKNFDKWQFTDHGKQYELRLDQKDTSYTFSEIYNSSSSTVFMKGQYKISNDSIRLIDIVNPMTIYKDSLIGFQKERIGLKKE